MKIRRDLHHEGHGHILHLFWSLSWAWWCSTIVQDTQGTEARILQIQVLPGPERVQSQPRQVIKVLSQNKKYKESLASWSMSIAPSTWEVEKKEDSRWQGGGGAHL